MTLNRTRPTASTGIRRLTASDARRYIDFRAEAVATAPTAFTSSAAEEVNRSVDWAVGRFGRSPTSSDFVLGAFLGEELVGIAGCRAEELRQARHKATLFGMAVASTAQGRGLGRSLVERLLVEATSTDQIMQVVLTVSAGNEAGLKLYSSCGFTEFGREPRAVIIAGSPVEKVHMIRMLDDTAK